MTHVYVYCAAEGVPRQLPAGGVPDGAPPRAIALDETASLVVSDVPADSYSPAALEPRLSDLDWVGAAGAAHHAVVDGLAEAGAIVLPVRLFTIFSTEEAARRTFAAQREAMARAFDRVRGREEWVLRIGRPQPSRAEAPGPARSADASGTSFLRAKADARRESTERAARVREDAVAAYEALAPLADAARTRAVDPNGALLIDAAFLVAPSRVDALRDALTRSAERLLRDGCPVSLTGPWPPYSFSSMDAADA